MPRQSLAAPLSHYRAAWRVTLACAIALGGACASIADEATDRVIDGGLRWLAEQQNPLGNWTAQGRYPAAMTALAGMAMLCEGSTPTQGKYADNLRRAVDYLVSQARPNGLIGDPLRDDRYTYGHGFSMLFLSQVLGEEEDAQRREELVKVLNAAVRFTGEAQTAAGGWGYVSAKDGNGFDEGSTTITQVQGLRGCRNAGVPAPKEVIDKSGPLHPPTARSRTAACSTAPRGEGADPRSPPRRSPACTTPANTTTTTSPRMDGILPLAAFELTGSRTKATSGTGTTPTSTTRRCSTARTDEAWETATAIRSTRRSSREADARATRPMDQGYYLETGVHRRRVHHRR